MSVFHPSEKQGRVRLETKLIFISILVKVLKNGLAFVFQDTCKS